MFTFPVIYARVSRTLRTFNRSKGIVGVLRCDEGQRGEMYSHVQPGSHRAHVEDLGMDDTLPCAYILCFTVRVGIGPDMDLVVRDIHTAHSVPLCEVSPDSHVLQLASVFSSKPANGRWP